VNIVIAAAAAAIVASTADAAPRRALRSVQADGPAALPVVPFGRIVSSPHRLVETASEPGRPDAHREKQETIALMVTKNRQP
jgi:hypothetical protein